MIFNTIIDKLIYKGDKENPDTYRKGRFFILFILIFLFFNLISIPYYFGESANLSAFVKSLYLITLFLLCSIVFIYPRFGFRLALANTYFFAATFYTGYSTYFSSGGIFSPDNAFSIVICVFVFLITNKVSGYFWISINILIVSLYYFAETAGYYHFRSTATNLPPDYFFSTYIFSIVFATIGILLHENIKEKYLKEIISAKSEIELKNKEITDSITYAKRIQQAKLPEKAEIFSSLGNSFILFKPKDIVSGDFYFFHKIPTAGKTGRELLFLAAADCTGHGVPGALMSMIASEQLYDAVSQCSDTSEILKRVNTGIKKTLKQSANIESSHDGMDIALVSLELKDQNSEEGSEEIFTKIKYAGANRPIWIIRKESAELEIIKATKKAIAGYTEDEQHFETHEILLNPGDSFYLFSDGFADSFSGNSGKKLTSKKFKEILLGIQNLTMQEQEKFLTNFIETWIGGIEQVDDILVIGVRVSSLAFQ